MLPRFVPVKACEFTAMNTRPQPSICSALTLVSHDDCDKFCADFFPRWYAHLLAAQAVQRQRARTLSLSEVMTLVILFHQSGYRNFKTFTTRTSVSIYGVSFHVWSVTTASSNWKRRVSCRWRSSCARALAAAPASPLWMQLPSMSITTCASGPTACSKTRRRAARPASAGSTVSKSTSSSMITPGNTDDRKSVPRFAKRLWGKLFGELLQWKRALIETVNDQLKNICQLEQTCHRSVTNFLVNLLTALIAYTYQEKKPSLDLRASERALLPVGSF